MAKNHFDVLIVGAGLSGIGMGCHLQTQCPDKSFAILEGRDRMGGTWDLFRYPGIRSDSNMHALSYNFRPWHGDQALADGPSILDYVKTTASSRGIDQHIQYETRVKRASWSSKHAHWSVEAETADGSRKVFTCNFLQMCAGYYSYKKGYTPSFAGREDFKGEVLHPQSWPEGFDVTGKRIVVIGSGATAVTLVPAMAESGAAHVVMLQRSPTYVVSLPSHDAVEHFLRRILPLRWAQALTRRKVIFMERYFFNFCRTKPKKAKEQILSLAQKDLPEGYDIEKHFSPRYNPWEQRMCLVPDSDLFTSIREGKASVVTEHIDRFTETGIRLKSGEELAADVIVTATGLDLVVLGETAFEVDGRAVDFSEKLIYKGLMYSGIPNMAATFGYINASWTLRADIQADYVCRLLNHLDRVGMRQAMPVLSAEDEGMERRSLIDSFSSGYLQRVMDGFPKQGAKEPWVSKQDYKNEKVLLRKPVDDGVLTFSNSAAGSGYGREEETVAAVAAS